MIPTTLTLHLNASQAAQLAGACAAYRAFAWQQMPPSPERTQLRKAAQAVQGRISALPARNSDALRLTMSEEERQALRQIIRALMYLQGAAAPCEERIHTLGNLAGLRMLIERAGRSPSPPLPVL